MLSQALQLFELEFRDHDPFPGVAGANQRRIHEFQHGALAEGMRVAGDNYPDWSTTTILTG